MYLRKSRADLEAEAKGEGETLTRHEKTLQLVAEHQNIQIQQIYKEIVSGETIAARPVMQHLLSEIEQGLWDCVFVMEIERLARGDTIDQGVMAQTFQYTGTKIITPLKTYDPNNPFDEEYFEFGLFMSRREYKTINRRMQSGRFASAKEGKYIGSLPPYGYDRIKIEPGKGYTLQPNPQESAIIQMIFHDYVYGDGLSTNVTKPLNKQQIANKLNCLAVPTARGGKWTLQTIKGILENPVYIGKIRWNSRPIQKKMKNGKILVSRPYAVPEDVQIFQGLHPAIVPEPLWQQAQKISNACPTSHKARTLKNPLNGLVICKNCGQPMVRRPSPDGNSQKDLLLCPTPTCDNIGCYLYLVEEHVLYALKKWLGGRLIEAATGTNVSNQFTRQQMVDLLSTQAEKIQKQMNHLDDLLEQDIYSIEKYQKRSAILEEKQSSIIHQMNQLNIEIQQLAKAEITFPNQFTIDQLYRNCSTIQEKNRLLKILLSKIMYYKSHSSRWHHDLDAFELTLYPFIEGSTEA